MVRIISTLRILILIFLSIICISALFITINNFYYSDIQTSVANPENAGIKGGLEYIFFLGLISIGSLFGVLSFIDLVIEKNKIGYVNLLLSIVLVFLSYFYL